MNVKPRRQRIQAKNSNVPLILVVEDDEDNLLFISHTLIFLQHDFITVSKGQKVLDLATTYEIDLILLDLKLPDIDGFELVSLLKQNKITKNTPIIAVSALVRPQERDRAMNVGCDDYLEKPYLIDDLERKIRRYLSRSFLSKMFFSLKIA